jgi:hypothetical protein
MSSEVYPAAIRGLAYNVVKAPGFSNIIQRAASGAETRIAQWQNPIWHWELKYNYLKDNPADIAVDLTYTDLQTLMGFYAARLGTFDDFLYSDPTDNTVNPGDQELQLVTDGTYYYTPIQRQIGGQFYEDVTDLDGPLALYADGVLQTPSTDYDLFPGGLAFPGYSFQGLVARWNITSPVVPPTTPITAAFSFFFRVRFESDPLTFEEFVNQIWTLGGADAGSGEVLKLITARVPLA